MTISLVYRVAIASPHGCPERITLGATGLEKLLQQEFPIIKEIDDPASRPFYLVIPMEIYRPQPAASPPETLAELTRLKTVIERAIADGRISADETAQIKRQIAADGLVTFQELELYRQLVLDKIASGELERDFDDITSGHHLH